MGHESLKWESLFSKLLVEECLIIFVKSCRMFEGFTNDLTHLINRVEMTRQILWCRGKAMRERRGRMSGE